MLCEIKSKLGFELIELGHGIRISLMPGIQKMFDAGEVRFSSLHNFCPLPVEVMAASPDCYQYSAIYPQERERAIKQTFQTIDFAAQLGAPFVVLHLGAVNMKPITDQLIELTKAGKYLSRKYVRLKLRAVQKRERNAATYLQRVKDCLRRVIDYAASKNVRLALEGRRGYEEIPTEREFPALLEELFITSTVHRGDWKVVKTDNRKCARCWRHRPDVDAASELDRRCEEVVNG